MAGLTAASLDGVQPLVVAADGGVVILLPAGATLLIDGQQAATKRRLSVWPSRGDKIATQVSQNWYHYQAVLWIRIRNYLFRIRQE